MAGKREQFNSPALHSPKVARLNHLVEAPGADTSGIRLPTALYKWRFAEYKKTSAENSTTIRRPVPTRPLNAGRQTCRFTQKRRCQRHQVRFQNSKMAHDLTGQICCNT
ncbi:uncharacterized protein LOC119769337 [Culex quinquefasciatus]|uniref:uncharacterized protein LOC119769337 n=1 Tax=Culex quinquefasciatus TaxID=7176 RepID=UPI0018E34422|nr:uncharacterized protein LOC119769337 [Culex quinquefasciatus]